MDTFSMEVHPHSVTSRIELESVRSLTRTASPAATSDSQQHDSDTTSQTTNSEISHSEYTSTELGDRYAIESLSATICRSIQHSFSYQRSPMYPSWIQHDDLHFTSPEPLICLINQTTQTSHRFISQPAESTSSKDNTTTDQNELQHLLTPMLFLPAFTPPARNSAAEPIPSEELRTSIQLQDWLIARLTEERMRVGHPRWENEEEGRVNLQNQIHNLCSLLNIEVNVITHAQ